MPIRQLPTLLINQIAAGEVIERPASVVKELVENSLDAGATRVDVAIEDGGKQLIRISDDGFGIAEDELELAVSPHATSKLTSADQLESIGTLGFRGEALASIASVSRLRITSRATVAGKTAESAAMLEVEGDQIKPVMPAGGAPGTIIEVRDLFFNTPARRKFLRAGSTESGHINDMLTRTAMVWHQVAFSLTHNGRKVFSVPADQTRRRRCVELIGKDLDEALLEFEEPPADAGPEATKGGMRIWGLAGLPSIARATSKFQYLCINGRIVRDRNLAHAIREAYRGLMPHDRQPVLVAFIEMDPTLVDVNVHPQKAEVRFREPSRIHGLVLNSIRRRLLASDLTPQADMPRSGSSAAGGFGTLNTEQQRGPGSPSPFSLANGDSDSQTPALPFSPASSGIGSAVPTEPPYPGPNAGGHSGGASHMSSADSASGTRAFVDYFRQMDPRQKGFAFEEVRRAYADENPNALIDSRDDADSDEGATDGTTRPVREPAPPLRILQVHSSYIVTEDQDGMLIIDQHALHERVMFEELRQRVLSSSLESQRLLMPATLRAAASRQAVLDDLKPLLERIGVEVDPLGPETVAVQAFPTFLFERRVEPVEFMEELLDRAEEGDFDFSDQPGSSQTAEEAALHEVLDMMACKAAVKAGDRLQGEELEALLARRNEIERASNCPHGRPTTIRLSLKDLEKRFGRT